MALLFLSVLADRPAGVSARTGMVDASALSSAVVPRVIDTKGLGAKPAQLVNVYLGYSKEPAPMGVADYGLGPSGPYEYSTNSSLGVVGINSFSTRNSTGNPWASVQLNVNLRFSNAGKTFVYWIQDVAQINTFTNTIYFLDNVWNSSSPTAVMSQAGISGDGQVAVFDSQAFYYARASAILPGNGVDLSYPADVEFRVNSTVNAAGQPAVSFEYSDGYGWQEYDRVAFTSVHQLIGMNGFVVDGYGYKPTGFYDSELVIGGVSAGYSTVNQGSDVRLQLEFWNGHNYQLVTSGYNFGSDTAETMSGTLSEWYYFPGNGMIVAEVQAGQGTLGKLWDQSGVGIVDLKSSGTAAGTLRVRSSANSTAAAGEYAFQSGEVTVTLQPGAYLLEVYSGASLVTSGNYSLAGGEVLRLSAPLKVVPFTLSYSVVGGGSGFSPPALTYTRGGTVQTEALTTAPTTYILDSGSFWSISSQLSGSGTTERWATDQSTNGTAASSTALSVSYYHQYLRTFAYSVSGGGSGYSPPSLSGRQFGAPVSIPLGTSPASSWLDSASPYSATDPLGGSTSAERWFASSGQATVDGPGFLTFAYAHQFYLTVAGGDSSSGWFNSGSRAVIGQPSTYSRAQGRGERVSSYSVDGGPKTPVQPATGNVTVSVTMDAPHTIAFDSVVQYQVTLDSAASQGLGSITPPTIGGDNYWYDSGSPVRVTLEGTWGRTATQGNRMTSYSINGGPQVTVSSAGPVTVLELTAISSAQEVSGRSTVQYHLEATSGSLQSVSPTPIGGDAGWYDGQTSVVAVYNYSWQASAGRSRLSAVSYSLDGGPASQLVRKASGTFAVDVAMDASHRIVVQSVTQYSFAHSGGFAVSISPASPTGDGFYDANSSVSVSSNYLGNLRTGERQALAAYSLDSITSAVPRNENGTFTTPAIVFDNNHTLSFVSVEQYLVSFSFTDSSGAEEIAPASLTLGVGGSSISVGAPVLNAWMDNGTSFSISGLFWEGSDVKPVPSAPYLVAPNETVTVRCRVYSASVLVQDPLGIPVGGAAVSARLANGTTATSTTGSNGVAELGLIPIGTYQATASSLGASASASADASVTSRAPLTVPLSLPVVGVAAAAALLFVAAVVFARRRHADVGP